MSGDRVNVQRARFFFDAIHKQRGVWGMHAKGNVTWFLTSR